MLTPDFGVNLRPKGLSVALNPNEVELHVTSGPAGAILTMSACGVSLRCALPKAAREHLIKLLSGFDDERGAAGRQ